jgi:hypothetical protein
MDNNTVATIFGNSVCKINGKGKSAVSYQWVEGIRIPTWVIENGGVDNICKSIEILISEGYDSNMVAIYFNVSPITMKNFIKNNIIQGYIDKELENRTNNIKTRRSKSLKGVSKNTKGKTYKEIYGDKEITNGFKRGDKNPNFTRDKYIGRTLTNKFGEKFRSSYEVIFSELLLDNNIPYDYEHHFKLNNGRVKIVDFIVNNIFVEVTGYAYEKWQQDFDTKILLLHQTYPDQQIVIICDDSKVNLLKERHSYYCTIFSLSEYDKIINHFMINL